MQQLIEKLSNQQQTDLETEFAENSILSHSLQVIKDNLKDGGSTEDLNFDITSAVPSQTMELRSELLGSSPHLSEDILKAAADRTDVLPEAILFEILAANPDELKNEDLIKYLQDKPNPLSEELIDILVSLAGDSTYKTALIEQIATHDSRKMRAAYSIIRDIVRDSTSDGTDLRNWLDNLQDMGSDYQIIDSWLQERNTASALALLNLIPQTYNLRGEDLTEFNYYKDLKILQANLITEDRNMTQLTKAEIESLDQTAQNSRGMAGVQSQNILEFFYGYEYLGCAALAGNPISRPIHQNSDKKVPEANLTASPNPASDWCSIMYDLHQIEGSGTIQINDQNGNPVTTFNIVHAKGQFVWDVRNITPGIYYISLTNEKFNKTYKLIVIH